jgi:integrase/recombinase XerD
VTHCRQVMLEELQRRNFAPKTISSYLHAVEQFARHFKCRPDRLNPTHLRSYQAYLLRERKMRPLTVRLHVAALRFSLTIARICSSVNLLRFIRSS